MGTQYQPVVRSFSSEGFIVAWESYGQDGNRWSLFGQLYNNDGSTVDGEFKIHTAESVRTDGDQYQLDVSTFFSGQFIVVWASHASNFEKSIFMVGFMIIKQCLWMIHFKSTLI